VRRSRAAAALAGALLAASTLFVATKAGKAQESPASLRPVKAVASERIGVATAGGSAALAVYLSASLEKASPGVTRAVIVCHGVLRNADVYFAGALQARAAAGPAADSSLMIAPQFLAEVDAGAHTIAADTLIWHGNGWSGGADAVAPAPVSAFAALDAILLRPA